MTPDTCGLRSWTTESVPPQQRLDYWIGAVCEAFLEMDISAAGRDGFESRLDAAPLDRLMLNLASGSGQDVYRRRAAIARSQCNYYYLLCKLDLPWTLAQGGRDARLLPGDLALVDSRQPYEFHFRDTVDVLSIQLPVDWLEAWLPDAGRHLARRIDGRSGWGQALSCYVRQLTPLTALAPPLAPRLMADQVGALLALATGGTSDEVATDGACGDTLAARAEEIIRARCKEPGLTAGTVADELRVSPRTLHRSLARAHTTFAACLMKHRLALARRMLLAPHFDHVTTAEIGRRAGLSDPSHFVRVCRRNWGLTPVQLRAQRY